ncbi:hypothetical protein PAXRUDRAFT_775273, partial [Paxillus rubicundulus Ve08.2h10]
MGSVINCTNCVMVTILDQHDDFMTFPCLDSQNLENAKSNVEAQVCPEWRNGIFAADGSALPLYAKPGLHGETFFDRKSNYSLSCQLVTMPHNLSIVDYGLGLPGSVHDAYAFQLSQTAKDHEELLGERHWIWADSAYPLETWCIVPFKKPKNGRLTWDQKTFNYFL